MLENNIHSEQYSQMNKKALLLLASTVLATGVISDTPAEARTMPHSNGAIIRQLPRDNTTELFDIEQSNSSYEHRFDKQILLINYYETNFEYEESDELFNELIGMLKDLDEPQKSIEIQKCQEIIRKNVVFQPNSARFYYRKSLWEKNFGSQQEAIAALKQALTIDKSNPQYHYDYAQFALDENQYDKAIQIYEGLKRHYPRDIEYRIGLAKAYTQAGKYDDAIREYRVASAFDPRNNDTIIALNELTGYSQVAHYNGGKYYDAMSTARPVASPSGEKLVAFNASENQLSPAEKAAQARVSTSQSTNQHNLVSTSKTTITQADKSMTQVSDQQPKTRKPAGTKRIMVSYINGRKVVKIVNINTEADASQSLKEASSTFANQLAESNSGYSSEVASSSNSDRYEFKTEHTPATSSGVTAFEKPLPDTTTKSTQATKPVAQKTTVSQKTTAQKSTSVKPAAAKKATTQKAAPSKYYTTSQTTANVSAPVAQTQKPVAQTQKPVSQAQKPVSQAQNVAKTYSKDDYPTKSKYQVNEKDYITDRKPITETQSPVAETTSSGDPNITALTHKATGRKQLLITYKNGKKVVQMVSADGTPISEIQAAQRQLKDQEKSLSAQEKAERAAQEKARNISERENEIRQQEVEKLQQQQSKEAEKLQKEQRKEAEKLQKQQSKDEEKLQKESVKQDKKIKPEKKSSKSSEKSAVQTTKNTADNTDLYIKANELLAQNQYQEVINVLVNVQPPTLRSLTSIASCYNALGQSETAIEYYKKADKLSPDNTQILYSIGYLYYTKNDVPSAKKYVDLALKADSTNQNAVELRKYMSQQDMNVVMNQAISFMNQGNYSDAKKILEKSLVDNPSDFQSYYYLGHIAYATNKYEEAAKNFGFAIKYNPQYALSYYSIGLAFDKLKEFNKSLPAYEQFIQMETDDNKYTQYAKTRINTIRSKK